ncbi:SDR family oxidoreductase [Luteibacter sp. dw_328]|uniref:SDR family NAD(P)-dependent oxidoreductase n=1 Tax=Luteibacter sp. dw_328 TaxID=2719796 RepID=UPI001BD6DCFC|nr:SDR family oxidoreductase [Luteibacter sp. dw_328]
MASQQRWALITGASSGLGRDFAHALAEKGSNVVLAARREEPMERLAEELRSRHGVKAKVVALDLSADGAAASLKLRLDADGIVVDTLINNAGHGITAEFLDAPVDRINAMLRLNVLGLTDLTHVFASDMAKRGGGSVMLVASVAAFQPCPHFAAYAASKAYVLSLGEALHTELKAKKVVVTVLSPGVTETSFFDAAGEAPNAAMKRMMMKSRPVVDIGLAAMAAGKSAVVAGRVNRVMAFLSRLFSRQQLSRITYRMATT